MKRFSILILAAFALVSAAMASEPSAAAVLSDAKALAAKDHKNVMVIFHASWCGWCKKLDEFLADKGMGKLMTDNFVIVHLDVMEQPEKKNLENEGGEAMLKDWKGEGLPFTVVMNPQGKIIADSNLDPDKSSNIGYPAKPEEIAHFMKMLKTAQRLSASDRSQIEAWLKEHAPKAG